MDDTEHFLSSISPQLLSDEERAIYEWQMWVDGLGEAGQRKLKGASVLVSRVGGVGGLVAYQLAAAGVGRLILAHAGNVRPSDLNRQLLMTHDQLGKPRIESAARRLRELNPRLEIVGVQENVSEQNAAGLVNQANLIVDCAPLFAERFALNRQAVAQRKPMVESAMFGLEGYVTSIVPGRTPCLACLYSEDPEHWRRQFPVLGAVSGAIACLAAVEAVKLIAGFGKPLLGRMFTIDMHDMTARTVRIARAPACGVCAHL